MLLALLSTALASASCGVGLSRILGLSERPDGGGDAKSEWLSQRDSRDADETRSDADAATDSLAEAAEGDAAPRDAPPDEADDESPADDAPQDVVTSCNATAPFGPPMLAPGLNETAGAERCARLSSDELSVSVAATYEFNTDLFISQRSNRWAPFGMLTQLGQLNSPSVDACLTMTSDGRTAYFESDRNGGKYGLWSANRASTNDPFPEATPVAELNVSGEGGPYLSADGQTLYFHSWRANGRANLYSANRKAGGFGTPIPLSVDTPGDEVAPVVSTDELTIYFAANGTPSDPVHRNIMTATRASKDSPFDPAVELAQLNTPGADETPSWISPDGCRLYFYRTDPVTGDWVYVTERGQ